MPQCGLASGESEAEQSISLATMTTHQKAAQLSTHKDDFGLSSPAIAEAVFFAILDSFTCASE